VKEMIETISHTLRRVTHRDLVEIATIVTQIIMEYGPNCNHLEIDPRNDEIRFTTVKAI